MERNPIRSEPPLLMDREAAWRPVVAGMLALMVAIGIGRFAFTPILPVMQAAFDLPVTTLGGLASSNYLGYLIGALLVALVPGRGQGIVLRGSLLLVLAATALMASVTDVAAWLLLRFLAGLASAGVFVSASTLVLGMLGRQGRSGLAGWFYSGVGLGIALSGLVILIVSSLTVNALDAWRLDWLSVAALGLALTLACWRWLPVVSHRLVEQVEPRENTVETPSFPLIVLCAAYFLEGAGYIVSGTFLVAIVVDLPGLGTLGPSVWTLVGLAAAPSTIVWAAVAARRGPIAALGLAYGAQAIGVALPALTGQAWVVALAALLFGGTFMGITALTIAYARQRVAPRHASRVIGLLTVAFGLGQVVGPVVAAAVAGDERNFEPALLLAASAVIAGGCLTVAAGRMRAGAGEE